MNEALESYLRDINLLEKNVVNYTYEKTLVANYYVTKFIVSDKIEWGVIQSTIGLPNGLPLLPLVKGIILL